MPTSNIDALLDSGLLTPAGGASGGPANIPLQTGMSPAGMGGAPDATTTPTPRMVDRIHSWLGSKLAGSAIDPDSQGLLGPGPTDVSPTGDPAWMHMASRADAPGWTPAPDTAPGPFDRMNAQTSFMMSEAAMKVMALREAQAGMAENQRIMGVRRAMAQQFPIAPNQSSDDTKQQLQQMYEYLIQNGDLEGAKELGQTARAIFAQPKATAQNPDEMEIKNMLGDPNGPNAGKTVTQIWDKRQNKVISELPEGAAPKSGDATQATTNARNNLREHIANDFQTATKPFTTALQSYRTVQAASAQPNSTTSPTLALMGLARMISPGSRTNVQAVQTLKGMTGSFSDKLQRYINNGMKGTAEPGFLPEIQAAADQIMNTNKQDYDTARQSHIIRAQAGGVWDDNMNQILAPAPTFGGGVNSGAKVVNDLGAMRARLAGKAKP